MKKKKKKEGVKTELERKIKKLEEEKDTLTNQLSRYKKEITKQGRIKNLKIFKHTLNYLIPFFVCSNITIGATALLGFGLPLKKDHITKVKRVDFSYNSDDGYEIEERYVNYNKKNSEDLDDSKLTIYYPWEENNGIYERRKVVYNLDEEVFYKLQQAIIDEDIQSIETFYDSSKEETQTVNFKPYDEVNDFYFDAELKYRDFDDSKKENESTERNVTVSVVSILIILILSTLSNASRGLKYRHEIEKYIYDYTLIKSNLNISSVEKKLDNVNNELDVFVKKLVRYNGKK